MFLLDMETIYLGIAIAAAVAYWWLKKKSLRETPGVSKNATRICINSLRTVGPFGSPR